MDKGPAIITETDFYRPVSTVILPNQQSYVSLEIKGWYTYDEIRAALLPAEDALGTPITDVMTMMLMQPSAEGSFLETKDDCTNFFFSDASSGQGQFPLAGVYSGPSGNRSGEGSFWVLGFWTEAMVRGPENRRAFWNEATRLIIPGTAKI